MEIYKLLSFSLSLTLILGVVHSFDYSEKELETEEGLQGMYDRWRDHHKVTEKSPERFNVFKTNVQLVHNHNRMNKPYKMHLNQFATMTKHEFVSTYGDSKIGHYAALQGIRKPNFTMPCPVPHPPPPADKCDLPPRVDWREHNAVTPVKNQGQCGSCFAFAAVGAIEGLNAIRTGQLVSLSEQQLLDCDSSDRTNHCGGGLVCGVFKFVIEHGGIATSESYPYVGKRETCDKSKYGHHAVTLDGHEYLPLNDEQAIMKAVSQQPVVFSMDPYDEGFMLYKEGVYTGPCGMGLNHAMLLVGYDETPEGMKYWIVKNSWGEGWGEKGYARMLRQANIDGVGLCNMYGQTDIPLKSPETKNIEL
ncbi:hypothetical protein R6Q59_035840 [Mikania micrantha]|uniref:Uncharacterized protein n=1 Tax=Mikania micrantha TaxID=192012 RepID=A0A5N6NE62_9ASTR|nr:hypothetical protein E3N88_23224 [Mikania micrantha]